MWLTNQLAKYIVVGEVRCGGNFVLGIFRSLKAGGVDYIVVGLGNPGTKYASTRHNMGFLALDCLAEKYGASVKKLKFSALCDKCAAEGKKLLLLKPQTFMNDSGEAVAAAAHFYKVPPSRVVVISDDVSLPCGALRIRKKGSAGGHKGLMSIAAHLKTEEFPRIKLGVGTKPDCYSDLVDWVLSVPSPADQAKISARFPDAADAVGMIVKGDIDGAMNRCNGTVL